MRRLLQQLAPVLRLTRVTTAFAAVANVWFLILWTRAHTGYELPEASAAMQDRPLWVLLLAGAGSALGLFSYGTSLNDVTDLHRDRSMKLDRPIGEGQISPEAVVLSVAGSLILAVLGATAFGTLAVLLTLLVALAILVFNVLGKFVPGFGMVLLGVIYAGHMLTPNVHARFLIPVWLVMTHALVLAGLTHRLARRTPPISRRAFVFAFIGWASVSTALAMLMWARVGTLWPEWVSPTAWIGPAVLAGLFVAMVVRRVRTLGVGPRAAEKVSRYGSLWLALYACAWLMGAGQIRAMAVMGVLAGAGFLGMTMLRELYALGEHPVGYRR
ncbi:MAG: UbiA family prenyltransferase [Phycisphaerales bacterium JB059]